MRRHLMCVLLAFISTFVGVSKGQRLEDGACPSFESNPWCPCYHINSDVFLECPMVSLGVVNSVLRMIQRPIMSFSIYDLDPNVTVLPSYLFKDSVIWTLHLSHSNVSVIHEKTFRGLEDTLKKLTLMHSKLTEVPQSAIQKLRRLELLDLEANNIKQIQGDSFFGMKLTSLNLNGNGLNYISEYAFDGLEDSLKELNLMNNALERLPISSVRRLKKLKSLKVTWNLIEEVQEDGVFSHLNELRELRLQNNEIRTINKKTFSPLKNLLELHLQENKIESIAKEAFYSLEHLQQLDLYGNRLVHFPDILSRYPANLMILRASKNNITTIHDDAFRGQSKLEILWLSENNISSIKEIVFSDLSSLKQLHLEFNRIDYIQDNTFRNLKKLEKTLDISNNPISEFTISTERLKNLKELDLSSTHLKSPTLYTYRRFLRLKFLSLSNNSLADFPTGSFASSSLEELNLSNNNLKEIPRSFLTDRPPMLKKLNVSGNPLNRA
ncbi:hypothetical protein HAZT_HAZT002942 [Hyalella azteca]|uniref:LRRNT domain-containing protein n=1 Tax=Hyalella azteca TaxID=294128 RepID=A0A6A0H583_HYAAZ|nr:hypothetical protein HAZT_HAZT002942 [Hyalella azteca]